MTTFAEYQTEALKTALPTAKSRDYLVHGLMAEWGEVHGVLAKSIRDEWTGEETRAALCKELGDVTWFIAVFADYLEPGWDPGRWGSQIEDAGMFLALGNGLVTEIAHAPYEWETPAGNTIRTQHNLSALWGIFIRGTRAAFGIELDEVLAGNLEKLRSRAERGTLQGSGDER